MNKHRENESADLSILCLDDEENSLKKMEQLLRAQGVKNLEMTRSIDHARNVALERSPNIFLCDLGLRHIDKTATGDGILRAIRNKKKGIFLALYSAYDNALTETARQVLISNNIFVYDKFDDELLLINLRADYEKFLRTLPAGRGHEGSEFDKDISEDVREEVLNHLSKISNKEVTVPIALPYERDYTVRELIGEVEDKTNVARVFIRHWLKAIFTIDEIRKDNTKRI